MTWFQRRGSKYGAKTQQYDGHTYHSKKEAGYAASLDLMKRAGEIKEWKRQVKISLDVNGMHIANYFCDFEVTMADGSTELHEVKGFDTEIYRLKRLLLEATLLKERPDIKYVVIR